MTALKQKSTRLQDLIEQLPAASCPSCHGFGHPRRSVNPWIGDKAGGGLWGEQQPVPDYRIDAEHGLWRTDPTGIGC